MRRTNVSFPHPILKEGSEDYIDCKFTISDQEEVFNSKKEINGKFTLTIEYELICSGLEKMILDKEAKVVLYLESKMTNYRKAFSFDSESTKLELEINKNELGDYIDIKPFIVSNVDKDEFILNEHNKVLFGSSTISIRKGDFLAEANGLHIILNKFDPLADKPSIFKIHVDYDLKEDYTVSWEYDHISITLNERLHGLYNKISQEPSYRIVLSSLFVTPALVDVLSAIKNANEDDLESYKTKKWYVVLSSRLKHLKIDLNSTYSLSEVANKILPIVSTAVSNIDYIINELYSDKGEK